MCKCTPGIKTPFCGKPGCEWPNTTRTATAQEEEGLAEAAEALHAACDSGKWTLIAPDGRLWMNESPLILFAVIAQIMAGNNLSSCRMAVIIPDSPRTSPES